MKILKCPKCGRQIEKNALVCEYCGSSLSQEMEVQSTEVVVVNDEVLSEETILDSDKTVLIEEGTDESCDSEKFTNDDDDEDFDILTGEVLNKKKKPKKAGWTAVTITIGLLMAGSLAAIFYFTDEVRNEGRLPDYEKIVERRKQHDERIREQEEFRQRDAQRIQDEAQKAVELGEQNIPSTTETDTVQPTTEIVDEGELDKVIETLIGDTVI